jgi:hypothetical protein
MAKKKKAIKKKSGGKKKPAPKKKAAVKKPAAKKKTAAKKKPVAKKAARRASRGAGATSEETYAVEAKTRRGTGSESGGQSGDTEGLSRSEDVDSESVEELVEEGQDFEAEVVSGVENAKDPDQGEVTTHEVPEDDVPREYDDQDKN